MFKRDNDNTNKKILNINKNKLHGKSDILNDILLKNKYIYKNVAIDNIDESIISNITKEKMNINNAFDICYNTNNNTQFCKTLKENFKSIESESIDYNIKSNNIINKTSNYFNYHDTKKMFNYE